MAMHRGSAHKPTGKVIKTGKVKKTRLIKTKKGRKR